MNSAVFQPFSEILSSLTLAQQSGPAWLSREIVPPMPCRLPSGRPMVRPSICVWWQEKKVPFHALIRALVRELEKCSHAANDDVALGLLGVLAFLNSRTQSTKSSVGFLSERLSSADVSHFFFLPGNLPEDQTCFDWHGFELGRIDMETFQRRCERAGSDYFEIMGKSLRRRFGLAAPFVRVRVFDFRRIAGEGLAEDGPMGIANSLVLNYFESTSRILQDRALDELERKEAPYWALEASPFEVGLFRENNGVERISVFLQFDDKETKGGYVVPLQTTFTMKLPDWKALEPRRREIQTSLSDNAPSFDGSANVFFRFASLCRRAAAFGRHNEAFLNAVIAMEILFSEKVETTKSVVSRTAALVWRRYNSFSESEKKIKELYDMRSRYVHQGVDVGADAVDQVATLIGYLAAAVLQVKDAGTLDQWRLSLDWVVAGLRAGIELDCRTLDKLGVLRGEAE